MGKSLTDLLQEIGSGATPWKIGVRLVSTVNLTLSGLPTIDDQDVAAGDRVLAAGQTNAKQNGIYVASATAWKRAPDMARDAYLLVGTVLGVAQGTANGGKLWRLTSPTVSPIRIDATDLTFTEWVLPAPAFFDSPIGGNGSGSFDVRNDTADATSARTTYKNDQTIEHHAAGHLLGREEDAAGLQVLPGSSSTLLRPQTSAAAAAALGAEATSVTLGAASKNRIKVTGQDDGSGVRFDALQSDDASTDGIEWHAGFWSLTLGNLATFGVYSPTGCQWTVVNYSDVEGVSFAVKANDGSTPAPLVITCSELIVNGGKIPKVVHTSNGVLVINRRNVLKPGVTAMTFPAVTNLQRALVVENRSGGNVTSTRAGSDTIDGGSDADTYTQETGTSAVFYEPDTGTEWEATPTASA